MIAVPSSSGLGRRPLTPETRVRSPLGPPITKSGISSDSQYWASEILALPIRPFRLLCPPLADSSDLRVALGFLARLSRDDAVALQLALPPDWCVADLTRCAKRSAPPNGCALMGAPSKKAESRERLCLILFVRGGAAEESSACIHEALPLI